MSTAEQWKRFNAYYVDIKELKLSIDLSRMLFPDCFLGDMALPLDRAFQAMAELERGGIANPDEKRMVGHYWLRNPQLAPNPEIRQQIESTLADIHSFTTQIHSGTLAGKNGPFRQLLIIGIGGSALGPQFVAQALGQPGQDKLRPYFFDNTDPDGFDKVLGDLNGKLGTTLTIVISKSGGTKETRNGMLEAKRAYTAAGLDFAKHAVAITGVGSELDQTAIEQTWIHRFPMWDWVGGRTSEMSAVGLLPAALQGVDIEGLISGARACDAVTRQPDHDRNPAALLALMWHYAGQGQGKKDMVILPYKDRLELFSKYLQQLVMESIGKELDLQGRPVYQGIAVYGNKGATDQHAYVQQLREGVLNFFVTFIEVLKDRSNTSMEVEPGVTSGDYLSGFLLGTREALSEKGRESITLTLDELTPFTVGVLIALYERAVGFYATLVGINAYHQPGVEAGKNAAGRVITLQGQVLQLLKSQPGHAFTPEQLGERLGPNTDLEALFKICNHLAANPARGVHRVTRGLPLISKFEYRP